MWSVVHRGVAAFRGKAANSGAGVGCLPVSGHLGRQRCTSSEAPCGVAAAHGVRRLAAAVCVLGRGGTGPCIESLPLGRAGSGPCNGMLSPRLQAGALGARARGGPRRTRKPWPTRVVYVREHQQRRDDRSAQGQNEGLGRGAVDAGSKEDPCAFQRTGHFWSSAGRNLCWGWSASGAMSAGRCCSGTGALR
jgi:hypothetical protein